MGNSVMLKYAIALTFALTVPASACWNAFEPCTDEALPMTGDSFMVSGRGARFILGEGPNVAVLASAASGCAQRGYPQFIIPQAQGGVIYNPFRSARAVSTTDAVVKCVRKGGIPVRNYLQSNDGW